MLASSALRLKFSCTASTQHQPDCDQTHSRTVVTVAESSSPDWCYSYVWFAIVLAGKIACDDQTSFPMLDIADRPADAWRNVLNNAYKHRIDPDRLENAFSALQTLGQAPSRLIIETVLRAVPRAPYDKDPLLARYLDLLVRQQVVSPGELLLGLLHSSAFSRNGTEATIVTATLSLPTFEEKVFLLLKNHIHADYFSSSVKAKDLVLGVTRWLHTISAFEISRQVELGPVHAISASAASTYESLGLLAYTILSRKELNKFEQDMWWKQDRSMIAEELAKFDDNVLQIMSSQLTGYLRNLFTQRPLLQTDINGRPSFTLDQVVASLPIVPAITTRAGLFVWLCTCLDSRPMTDDATMRNHLLVRYADNAQNAALGLILASFDVLSRPRHGRHPADAKKLVKSFICNKLPLLLASLGTLMTAHALESCVSMAMLSLPTEQAGAPDEMHQTQQSFLRSCQLHEVVTQTTVSSLMPELSETPAHAARYIRTNLKTQCTADMSRLDNLLGELDKSTGNAGAISGCVVDLIKHFAAAKDLTALKDLSLRLLRKLSLMDVIMQYAQPTEVMHPMLQLLNDWTSDQEHSEFQPPFEDFAGIHLFANAVIHRYGLTRSELGITNSESFLGRSFTSMSTSYSLIDLTEKQNTQLSLWIQGLYATDDGGEIVGISDEVYSTCPPQAFYLLVPTILEQTVLACKAKALSPAIMKAGLEFLLEPFLLPSLISGLRWAATSTWKDTEDTAIRIQLLEKLLKPVSTSQEAQMMHKAALTIVAVFVECSLQHLLNTTASKKKEINALIQLLRPYCEHNDMSGTNLPDSHTVLSSQLTASVQDLVIWTSQSTIKPPPAFSGRLISQCLEVIGSSKTLDLLVHEVVAQLDNSGGAAAVDICSALIGSPDLHHYSPALMTGMTSTTSATMLSRELALRTSDTAVLLSMPPKKAEALVRLQKAAQLQSAISSLASQLAMVTMALPTQASADEVMRDLALDSADANLAAAAVGLPDGTAITGITDSNVDAQGLANLLEDPEKLLGLGSADDIFDFKLDPTDNSAQMAFGSSLNADEGDVTANADDDIFGDLDMANLGGYDFT